MIRATIFLCFLAIFALSAPVPNDERPNTEQLVKPLEPITREDINLLIEMAKDHKDGQTPEDFLQTIKIKSPSIYNKISKVRNILEETYNLLNEEAQNYIKNAIAEIIASFRAFSNEDIRLGFEILDKARSRYENLSEEAKASLEKQKSTMNPVVKSLIPKTNEKKRMNK